MKRLENKTAIVTGGANGIGRAISELFAEEGAWVLVVDIEEEAGADTVCGILKQGGQAQFLAADVADPARAGAAVRQAVARNGRVDVLCNNAAYLGKFQDIVNSTE